MADPKSKTLPLPGNAIADPDFYADQPTASRGTPRDDGNLVIDGTPSPPKPLTSGGPFKNLTDGK
jgi:hypothetical protein